MVEMLLRMLACVTCGLLLALLVRRPARRAFGPGPAFALWLLPPWLALAPLLPQRLAPAALAVLPPLTVTPYAGAAGMVPAWALPSTAWLIALWLAGAGIGVVRLVAHYACLLRGARTTPDSWAPELAESVPMPDVRRVRVHSAGPAVLWALPRTLVLLPGDFPARFDAATRQLVLRHELAHVRRGDAWWTLAMEVACALLWFHPLAWLARPRFRLDQELACDAAALGGFPERAGGYARALLGSAAAAPAPALIPWLAEPQLKERIAMLAHEQPGLLRRRAGFLAVALALGGGVAIAGGQAPVRAAPLTRVAPTVDVASKNANPPSYPQAAIAHHEQGMVTLNVTVDAAGHVTGVAVDPHGTTASGTLQTAALRAAAGWTFHPGTVDGKAAGGIARVPVNFALDGDAAK